MFQAQELIPSPKARENKNKNKQMGPNQTFKLLYIKGSHLKKKKKRKKRKVQNGRKYLPTEVIRSSFPKYTNSSYNSTITKKPNIPIKKMGRRP